MCVGDPISIGLLGKAKLASKTQILLNLVSACILQRPPKSEIAVATSEGIIPKLNGDEVDWKTRQNSGTNVKLHEYCFKYY